MQFLDSPTQIVSYQNQLFTFLEIQNIDQCFGCDCFAVIAATNELDPAAKELFNDIQTMKLLNSYNTQYFQIAEQELLGLIMGTTQT